MWTLKNRKFSTASLYVAAVSTGFIILLLYNFVTVRKTLEAASGSLDRQDDGYQHQDHAGNVTPKTERFAEPGICSMTERQRYTADMCREINYPGLNWTLNHADRSVLVDAAHRLLYCVVPKCGSISFRTLLGKLVTHDPNFEISYTPLQYLKDTGFRFIYNVTKSEQNRVLRVFSKFVIVRHPFDKLRAIYDDKLSQPGRLNAKALGKNLIIIERYLKGSGIIREQRFDPWTEILTFKQFLELLATEFNNGFRDTHWLPTLVRCIPCQIKYDYILRLETITTDIKELYDHLQIYEGANPLIQVPHLNLHVSDSSAESLARKLEHLTDVYKYIDPGIINKLIELYKADFKLFGYTWTGTAGASCGIRPDGRTNTCC